MLKMCHSLRARLAERRERCRDEHNARVIRESKERERRETARVRAAWNVDACDPEAMRIAREMAVRSK